MEYSQTETLKPNEEKGLIPANYNDTLETAMQEIGALRGEVNALDSKVDGLDTSVNTQSVNAQSVSGQTITGNSVSANTLTGNEVNAGEVNTTTLNASGKASVKQLEVNDDIKADSADIDDITSNTLKTGTLEAATLNVNDFNVNNLDVQDIDVDDVTANQLTATEAGIDDATITNADIQEAEIQEADIETLDVTDTLNAKDVNVTGDLDVKNLTGKEIAAGDFISNSNSGNTIAVTEDCFIGIKPAISSEVRFILKDSNNTNLLTGSVAINEPETGKPTLRISYFHNNAVSDIYVDTDGNLWFKLEPGIRGTLYFSTFGMEKIIPETDSIVNPPFDTTTADHYVVTEDSGLIVFSLANVIIDSELEVTKDTVFHGNVRVEGILSIAGLEAEYARYLGESEYVTADENGVIEAKGANIDGDVDATNIHASNGINADGDGSVGGDFNVGKDITAIGDIAGKNLNLSDDATIGGNANITGDADVGGDLSVTGTINGDLSGNVTGDLTGNVTGNVTGDVDAEDVSTDTLETTGNTSVGGDLSVTSLNDATKYKYLYEGYKDGNILMHDGADVRACIFTKRPLTTGTVFVSTENELISALTDSSVSRIAIIADITINEDITFNGSKQIYGTPKPNSGSKMTLRFKKLTGTSIIQFFDLNLTNSSTSWSMECDFSSLYLENCGMSGVKYKQIYSAVDSDISGRVGYSSNYLNPTSDYPMKIYLARNCNFSYLWITNDYFWELREVHECSFKEIVFRYAPSSVETPTNVYLKISSGSSPIDNCDFNFKVYKNSNTVNPIEYLVLADINMFFPDTYYMKYHIFEKCNFKFDFADVSSSGRPPLCIFKFRNSSSVKNLGLAKDCNFLISGTKYHSYQQTVLAVFNFGINRNVSFENNVVNFNSNGCNACIFSTSEAQGTQVYSNWMGGIRNNKFIVPRSSGTGTEIIKMVTGCNFVIIGFTGNEIEYSAYNSFSCINGIVNNIIGLLNPDELVNDSANTVAVSASNNAYNYNNYYYKG